MVFFNMVFNGGNDNVSIIMMNIVISSFNVDCPFFWYGIQGTCLCKVFENLKNTNVADLIVVATTLDENDNLLCELANNYNFEYFRGSSEDKLDRWLNTCKEFKIDCFVNDDGDDIFFDYKLADIVLEKIQKYDFIDGSGFYNDVYGVNFHALNKVCKNKKTNETEFIKPFFLNDKSLNIHKLDNIDYKYYKKDAG